MNDLIQKGENLALILSREELSETDLKIMKAQEAGLFVPCMRTRLNGSEQLYYLTEGHRTLGDLIEEIDVDQFLGLLGSLIDRLLQVRENGFLSLSGLETDPDRIFVQPDRSRVLLIYVPIHREEDLSSEGTLRADLIRIVERTPWEDEQLVELLRDVRIPLREIRKRILRPGRLRLVAKDLPGQADLVVDHSPYIIGKNPKVSDGIVRGNPAVSRRHCRITRSGLTFRVEDLGSVNGTFVDQQRLGQGESKRLKSGSVLRLADSDFVAEVE